MALTILAQPQTGDSLQGDLIYTVSEPDHTSDPTTYPNYKFVAEVYVGATLVYKGKAVPQPITGIGVFNIGQIVRNYVAATFGPQNILLGQTMGEYAFYLDILVSFGEEYSYTEFTGIVDSDESKFFNYYLSRGHYNNLPDLYNKVLSERPRIQTIRCDSKYNLIPYLPTTTDLFQVNVKVYDLSDNETSDFNYGIIPNSEYELQIINASKNAINAASPDAINSSSKYFTLEFNSDGILYRFNLQCECVYEVYTLHFLNKYGGWESKDFNKVSRKFISVEKKDFGKLPYTVDSEGGVSYQSNGVWNETRSIYSIQFKEKMTLNTDWLTDDEYTWLQQLIVSPMVYIEDIIGGDPAFTPIVVSDTNYEPKKAINDDLTNLTINIEFGETGNAQYR